MATYFRPPIRNNQGPRLLQVENPPEARDSRHPARDALMRHIRHHGGYPCAVTITAGVVEEHVVLDGNKAAAAQQVFVGGHDYPVSAATAALLTAAGYAADLTVIP